MPKLLNLIKSGSAKLSKDGGKGKGGKISKIPNFFTSAKFSSGKGKESCKLTGNSGDIRRVLKKLRQGQVKMVQKV